MKSFLVSVSLDAPDEVSLAEIREYVRVAVDRWRGGYPPDDPMCNAKNITVQRAFERKPYEGREQAKLLSFNVSGNLHETSTYINKCHPEIIPRIVTMQSDGRFTVVVYTGNTDEVVII